LFTLIATAAERCYWHVYAWTG